jgi:hypothetical protein
VRPFTVETYNAHDRGSPASATFVHVSERPRLAVLKAALPGHEWMFPARGSDTMGYDTARLKVHDCKIEQAWESGADHGQPGTTPDGFVLSWWGEFRDPVDPGERVAFVCAHLVNNAFGPNLRGERELRLRLWWQGWRAMTREARRLRGMGYVVFKLGDLNRRPRYWSRILERSIGVGYDRIVYPPAVVLLRSWRGAKSGSDHRPLIGEFRFRDS